MRLSCLIFLTIIIVSKFAYAWSFEYLDTITSGCIEQSKSLTSSGETDWEIGENYEYCGCTTNGISKNFSVSDVIDLMSSDTMLSNTVYLKVVDDCLQKIGR